MTQTIETLKAQITETGNAMQTAFKAGNLSTFKSVQKTHLQARKQLIVLDGKSAETQAFLKGGK